MNRRQCSTIIRWRSTCMWVSLVVWQRCCLSLSCRQHNNRSYCSRLVNWTDEQVKNNSDKFLPLFDAELSAGLWKATFAEWELGAGQMLAYIYFIVLMSMHINVYVHSKRLHVKAAQLSCDWAQPNPQSQFYRHASPIMRFMLVPWTVSGQL